MIEDGVSSSLFDTTTEAIARVGELLESEDRRSILGEAAREHASRDSWRASATVQLVGAIPKLACAEGNLRLSDEPATAGSCHSCVARMKEDAQTVDHVCHPAGCCHRRVTPVPAQQTRRV